MLFLHTSFYMHCSIDKHKHQQDSYAPCVLSSYDGVAELAVSGQTQLRDRAHAAAFPTDEATEATSESTG